MSKKCTKIVDVQFRKDGVNTPRHFPPTAITSGRVVSANPPKGTITRRLRDCPIGYCAKLSVVGMKRLVKEIGYQVVTFGDFIDFTDGTECAIECVSGQKKHVTFVKDPLLSRRR